MPNPTIESNTHQMDFFGKLFFFERSPETYDSLFLWNRKLNFDRLHLEETG